MATPDDASKNYVGRPAFGDNNICVKALLGEHKCSVVFSEERVLFSFAQILDQVRCVSSERSTNLIVKEVAESVSSALSTVESVTTQRIYGWSCLQNVKGILGQDENVVLTSTT